uniref:BED-type domain-containing protein n=1 Tax=Poecilia formosa TaxID=48698 RepID=A0A096LS02_POEFO
RKRSVVWSFFTDIDEGSVQCVLCNRYLHKKEHGSTTPMLRHLRLKHPTQVYRGMERDHEASASHDHQHMKTPFCFAVVVSVDDDESNTRTTQNDSDPSTAVSGLYETCMPQGGSAEKIIEAEEGLAQDAFHSEAGENSSERPQTKDRRRSVIWRHFERLESSEAAQCRICMRKLQCYDSGCTGNLHRHLSKRHPKVFSELGSNSLKQLSPDSNGHGGTTESPLMKHELSATVIIEYKTDQTKISSSGLKISRQPEVEVRVFERELELIEALRRTQREEAQALQQQRELLEKLQTVGAREAAAERETIESLRKAQQEEADELIRQREELEKEKAELRKKWEELYQEKEEF